MRDGGLAPRLEVRSLVKTYAGKDAALEVLDGVSLTLHEEEFVSLIGPSGCGKSTIFHLLCGLQEKTSGEILLSGKPISGGGHFAYMPQKDLLMDWKRVADNIALPLTIRGVPKAEARRGVEALLPRFGLEGFGEAWPRELSGGMRQRAALLRTFLTESDILLLDEPFAALDALSREAMQQWLLDILAREKRPVILITHSIDEAIFLSDTVYVLSPRPARVKERIVIDLPFPREREVVTSPSFARYKALIWEHLEV